jgi:hypothetical protein
MGGFERSELVESGGKMLPSFPGRFWLHPSSYEGGEGPSERSFGESGGRYPPKMKDPTAMTESAANRATRGVRVRVPMEYFY